MRRHAIGITAAVALLTLMTPGQSSAQQMRLIVGVAPGASTDTLARILAEKMSIALKETVVVENRPGAASRLALMELKKSPPDGRTWAIASNASFSLVPHIYGAQLGYDPKNDFATISRLVAFSVGFAAGKGTGATNVKEFTAWAKAQPKEPSYGSPGAGTTSHFGGLMLAKAIGVPMTHVPYKGGAPAINDVIGGHIPLMASASSDFPSYHRAGQLRVIATAGPKRSAALPDVPTLTEQGVAVSFQSAFDMHTAANVPPDVVKRINAIVVEALKAPDVRQKIESMGLEIVGSTPEELAAIEEQELKMWEAPVKESGFKG